MSGCLWGRPRRMNPRSEKGAGGIRARGRTEAGRNEDPPRRRQTSPPLARAASVTRALVCAHICLHAHRLVQSQMKAGSI